LFIISFCESYEFYRTSINILNFD